MSIPLRKRNPSIPLLAAMLGITLSLGAGCVREGAGPDPRLGPRHRTTGTPVTGPRAAELRRAMENICDRMEDCAVERNVALARTYGGTRADVDAAREQARRALHSGYVRRWYKLKLVGLTGDRILRIRRCLSNKACEPFFRCAAIPDRPVKIRRRPRKR